MTQENKRLDRAGDVRPWNADGLARACDFCGDVFRHYAAHIMVPSRVSDVPGIYGVFCSWNCAKRSLLRMRNRPWFALMAITALRTGCRLPLRTDGTKDQVVRFIPSHLANVNLKRYINTPLPPVVEEKSPDDDEPQVYDIF